MSEEPLVQACEATATAIADALSWIADPKNDVRVAQERLFLERNLRGHAYQARRLARSVTRPMCVGVFGPSQAGKSYLISVLARKGDSLTALFNDPKRPEVDFIAEINPYGEKEATGLVTRFSIHHIPTPPGFPVALRLLTQTDILKILANSYVFDTDHQDETVPTPEEIDQHIAHFEARMTPGYVDVLREEDMWDVEEYFQRQLRRSEAKVLNAYWERLAKCAPRLTLPDRCELLSLIWGRHKPLTDLYRTLLEYLAKLGFTEEAFCPLDSLIPAANGILNVETLSGLDRADAERLRVANLDGHIVDMPRPVVTALAAELRVVLKENPWPFLDHTDLLDFPGYRSRTLHHLGKYLSEGKGNALKELFLRGKVDYLFQRYTAEQELTSMLLCLRPSNLDVTSLPAVIEEWIAVTHGRTPEERRGRPILLFFLLTMFDQHLAEKVADEGAAPELRFQARMEASLLKPFAKVADSWPLLWAPGEPFRNCYWIRNPNYKAEGIIEYDGRREVHIHEKKVARIAELRAACANVPEVRAHFRDPLRAFDEVMRLNDGGVSYLAENVALVCKPGMKRDQVRARLLDLRQRVSAALSPLYIPTDAEKRVAERAAVADKVVDDFEECINRNAFGTFLRGFCTDRGVLADALYQARARGALEEDAEDGEISAPAAVARPTQRLSDRLRSRRQGTPVQNLQNGRNTRTDHLVRKAMQIWVQTLHETSDDELFATTVGVPNASLKQVATELIATSRRFKLEDSVRSSLAEILHFGPSEQAAIKATIVAERLINNFVAGLGNSNTRESRRQIVFNADGMADEPANFQLDFAMAWLDAFSVHAIENAKSVDGLVHDPEQNMRLGRILQAFEATPMP
jgi:hypothetical protein